MHNGGSERGAGDREVLAVRYGTRTATKAENFLNWHVYGEPDEPITLDYFFWIVRDSERTVVIDCGFAPDVGRRRGRTVLVDPVEALTALGIDPSGVERLVVSHAHYDHIGRLDHFPEAEIVMTRRELDFWTGPYAGRRQFAHPTEPEEIAALERAWDQGRVTTFDRALDLGGGLRLVEVGGHTPGQLIALADVDDPDGLSGEPGTAVLATDALHFYEEAEADRPFSVVADLEAMYACFDTLNELARRPGHALVAGHDTAVGERFPRRASGTGMDELVVRIGGADVRAAQAAMAMNPRRA